MENEKKTEPTPPTELITPTPPTNITTSTPPTNIMTSTPPTNTTTSTPPTNIMTPTPPTNIMPLKKSKKCKHPQCTSFYLRLVGHCPHCDTDFCAAHRLPEDHKCAKLEDCRLEAFNKNKTRLESERTVASKMAVA